MTVHKFYFTIAYADTDAGGIVYHGRYIEMAERARMDWSRGIKLPDGDFGFVVRELDIKYGKPLLLADDIIIETYPIYVGGVSAKIEQRFIRDADVCAVMRVKIAYLGRDMRPCAIPNQLMQLLQ